MPRFRGKFSLCSGQLFRLAFHLLLRLVCSFFDASLAVSFASCVKILGGPPDYQDQLFLSDDFGLFSALTRLLAFLRTILNPVLVSLHVDTLVWTTIGLGSFPPLSASSWSTRLVRASFSSRFNRV